MKKSVIAVLLAMLLVFSLSACGGDSEDSGSSRYGSVQSRNRAYIPSV